MTTASSVAEAATRFASTFSGQFLRQGDHGYDEVRRVHNAMVDKRPAVIARCNRTADIAAAVAFAR